MINRTLIRDYLERCGHRLAAVEVLYERRSWPDVVRECQEIVELALKALLRHSHVDAPRVHDVGKLVLEFQDALPEPLRADAPRMAAISKRLRRDRELAFYGSEDLTPGEFYSEEDAREALDDVRWLVEVIVAVVLG